jgi:hypothetical protein
VGHHPGSVVDHPLDGVGDLELTAGTGLDAFDGVEHRRGEQVDAH